MAALEAPFWQQRIESTLTHMAQPQYRARNFTFLVGQDEESERRQKLPPLSQFSDYVRYDSDGFVYISRWTKVDEILPTDKVVGPHQDWRDYSANPPKTKQYYRLGFDQVRGIDIALRRSIEVRDKYRRGGSETEVIMDTFQRLGQLRRELGNYGELSDEDLTRIILENEHFLEGQRGMMRPKLRGKQRILRHLQAGFIDESGQKNYGAAMMRILAVELELYKRWEVSFPPILGKMATIVQILEFEREYARQSLVWAQQRLEEAIDMAPNDGESTRWFANRVEQKLFATSFNLTHNVVVRPYSLAASDLSSLLGAGRQTENIEPTAMRLIRNGQLEQARGLLVVGRDNLQKTLDDYSDYMAVEKGVKTPRPKRRAEVQPQMPLIFRH